MNQQSVSPKISVLIPVYNVEKYVGRCIDSLLGILGLEDRMLTGDSECTSAADIDWQKVNEVLAKKREEAKEYLSKWVQIIRIYIYL